MGISDILDRARLVQPADEPLVDVPDDASSLEEETLLDDVLPPDPKPGKRRAKMRGSGHAPLKVTAAQRRQVADALVLMQQLLGGGLQFRDPVCGGAILSNAQNVADKAVPIICRNPAWLSWFTGSAGFLDVIGLALALKPVALTVWGHHVSHSISSDHPGEAPVDYSAYSAPSI